MSPSSCTYGQPITASDNAFSKIYYHFNGWSGMPANNICNGNATLTATWAGNQVSIGYSYHGHVLHLVPAGYHGGTTADGYNYVMNAANSIYVQIAYGENIIGVDGLWNYHNKSWLYIKKSSSKNGSAPAGSEWKGTNSDTNGCRNVVFNQATQYKANQMCDNRYGSCVCRLRVNWS